MSNANFYPKVNQRLIDIILGLYYPFPEMETQVLGICLAFDQFLKKLLGQNNSASYDLNLDLIELFSKKTAPKKGPIFPPISLLFGTSLRHAYVSM